MGFVIQWAITLPQVRHFIRGRVGGVVLRKEVKNLAKAFGLGALGVGAVQINSFLDVIFARFAHVSGPVYLWYANRFYQLALALFGIAAVSTLVPLLSRAIKGGDVERGREIFAFGCRRILTVMIPMTFAIYALGFPAIDMIFGRGSFSIYAVDQTAGCLAAYGLGLIPAALIILYSAVLYGEGDFHRPMVLSLMTVGLNLGLNSLFVFGLRLGPISTALATSISAWANYLALRHLLFEKRVAYGILLLCSSSSTRGSPSCQRGSCSSRSAPPSPLFKQATLICYSRISVCGGSCPLCAPL